MPKISFPPTLQKFVGERSNLNVTAASIEVLIFELKKNFPELISRITADGKTPLRFIKIFVNGVEIGQLEGVKTGLSDGDVVNVVMALAGG